MPLSILLVLVVGGIAGIALLLHLSGRSRQMVLSPDTACTEWARHFPEDTPVEAMVTQDGQAALVLTRQGPGLVWAMGLDTTARHLRDFKVVESSDRLTVLFHDFSAPKVTLNVPIEMHNRWLSRMDPI